MSTFTVQTDAGLPNANSYIPVSFVDDYASLRGYTSWASASTADKEFSLLQSTQYLEEGYGSRFRGNRVTASGLHWPVVSGTAYDTSGYILDTVPTVIKNAAAELAVLGLTETLLPIAATTADASSISQGVGPISRTVSYQSTSSTFPFYPRVKQILVPALRSPSVIRK